jgi:hypothetical protein
MNSLDPWDQNDNSIYYSGTVTAVSNGNNTMTDASKSWTTNQFDPSGEPYSVYDVTKGGGFVGEIASNTSNTLTLNSPPAPESSWYSSGMFTVGDTYEIIRSTTCIDQPGRGGPSTYLPGLTPTVTGWGGEALAPIYQWNDTGRPNYPMGSNSGKVIANRDYYPQASGVQTSPTSPFNGTSGTGWGTLANRPTTCTPGVGYFATDQGSQGELFACGATNTWALYYTPYTYPHPLTGGDPSGPSGNVPQPPTGLTASVQ